MLIFYNILITFVYFVLRGVAYFNKKINLFVTGRSETFQKLSVIKKNDRVIWIHAASLGEFEQGRPIIEALNLQYPTHKIVVTFFSPSGYEVRKTYATADVVCYLPFDTKKNMTKFITTLHPELAILVKYEFWPNLLKQLETFNIHTILISGIFRKNQLFFKAYGEFMRRPLNGIHHFFVQDKNSKLLLNRIAIERVTIAGDTRFDRVYNILEQNNTLDFINDFKNNTYTVVAGSTWPQDHDFLIDYINRSSSNEKFIIAPHNIKSDDILALKRSLQRKVVCYSDKDNLALADYDVFILDTIGLLTKVYAYADTAYVGGGLSTGLHNILEPATFGVPIVIGGHMYTKFKEAVDLIALKGCVKVHSKQEFSSIFASLKSDIVLREDMGHITQNYIKENIGATPIILKYIKRNL